LPVTNVNICPLQMTVFHVVEVRPCKSLSQVGDNPVGYPEPMGDVLYELSGIFRRDRTDGADLDSLGEFVHHHQDVLVPARGRFEGSYRVEDPYGEGPGQWNCP
jgi:hypothetical protein